MKRHNSFIILLLLVFSIACQKQKEAEMDAQLPYESEIFALKAVTTQLPYPNQGILFSSEKIGFLLAKNQIFKSEDGGRIWEPSYTDVSSHLRWNQIIQTGAQTFYVVGGSLSCSGKGCTPPGGIILRTTDNGQSWDLLIQDDNVVFEGITKDANNGLFVIGNGHNAGFIYKWDGSLQKVVSSVYPFYKIDYFGSRGFASCIGGPVYIGTNDGNDWNISNDFQNESIRAMGFGSAYGYLLGKNSEVYSSDDGGLGWKLKYSPYFNLRQLIPLGDDFCLSFGGGQQFGGCFPTENGGITFTRDKWNSAEILRFTGVRAITDGSFYSSTQGFLVAGNYLLHIHVKL